MSNKDRNRGGETQGNRDRMDSMTRQMVEAGNSVEYSKRITRECALRDDGDMPGGGDRRNITDGDRRRARDRANRTDW